MIPCPKETIYRSQKMKDLADECPRCQSCWKPKDGTIVGAHIPFGKDKALGQKPSDIVAFLCADCHDIVDGRAFSRSYTKEQRLAIWSDALWWSVLWMLQSGHLEVRK
jgi:formate-dependent nitrite reductase cytochrome c552 subunit